MELKELEEYELTDKVIIVYTNRKMWKPGHGRIITPDACELVLAQGFRICSKDEKKDLTLAYLMKNATNFSNAADISAYLERIVKWIKENTCKKHSLLVF
jgi:hypothetical protein